MAKMMSDDEARAQMESKIADKPFGRFLWNLLGKVPERFGDQQDNLIQRWRLDDFKEQRERETPSHPS